MVKRIIYTLMLVFVLVLNAMAQELQVKRFIVDEGNVSAQSQPVFDLNGQKCALVQVGLALDGAKFDGGGVKKVEQKLGEYWVYVVKNVSQFRVLHKDYIPLVVDFSNYGLGRAQSGMTYVLTLVRPDANVGEKGGGFSSSSSSDTLVIPVKGVNIEMVKVEAGTFQMGATSEMQNPWDDEKPVHQVTLTHDYYIGKYEVTQALWQAVMGKNPSCYKFEGGNMPVENVSWNDCQKFIKKLNNLTHRTFRLPTEAEWEYAARGGKKSQGYQYSGSNNLDDVAWYGSDRRSKPHAVGMKRPNELGLYDMSGNVSELCQDWKDTYHTYPSYSVTNPTGASSGVSRVCRGGCWFNAPRGCRASSRGSSNPNNRDSRHGLRLVLSLSE